MSEKKKASVECFQVLKSFTLTQYYTSLGLGDICFSVLEITPKVSYEHAYLQPIGEKLKII